MSTSCTKLNLPVQIIGPLFRETSRNVNSILEGGLRPPSDQKTLHVFSNSQTKISNRLSTYYCSVNGDYNEAKYRNWQLIMHMQSYVGRAELNTN